MKIIKLFIISSCLLMFMSSVLWAQEQQQTQKKQQIKKAKKFRGISQLYHLHLAGGVSNIKVANRWAGEFQGGLYYSLFNFLRMGSTLGITYAKLGETSIDNNNTTLTLPNNLNATSNGQTITQDILIVNGMVNLMFIAPIHRFFSPYADIGVGYVFSRNRSVSQIETNDLTFHGFIIEAKGGFDVVLINKIQSNISFFAEAGYRWAKPEFSIFIQDLSGAFVRAGFSFAFK